MQICISTIHNPRPRSTYIHIRPLSTNIIYIIYPRPRGTYNTKHALFTTSTLFASRFVHHHTLPRGGTCTCYLPTYLPTYASGTERYCTLTRTLDRYIYMHQYQVDFNVSYIGMDLTMNNAETCGGLATCLPDFTSQPARQPAASDGACTALFTPVRIQTLSNYISIPALH